MADCHKCFQQSVCYKLNRTIEILLKQMPTSIYVWLVITSHSQSFLWWKTWFWSSLVWWSWATSKEGAVVYYPLHHKARVVTVLPGRVSYCVESSSRRHRQRLIRVRWTVIVGFWLQ